MNNDSNLFDSKEAETLIKRLVTETERYQQEKLVQKIGRMKDEQTANRVIELLYSEDAYIRNIAIEILISLGEVALPILKEKLTDPDRNIRKSVLDTLKYIMGMESRDIALTALYDGDENVVVATLEVIANHQFIQAEDQLIGILKMTSSVWIINALLRTFASLGLKNCLGAIEEKIFSFPTTYIEKNILMNTYVRTLGCLGSYLDLESIINIYSKEYTIEDTNLIFGLSSLIVNSEITEIPDELMEKLLVAFKEHWDFRDSSQIFVSLEALVKLQMGFFLDDVGEIVRFYKDEEFFIERFYELLLKLDKIPVSIVNKILDCEETDLVKMGLKLIHTKQLGGYNGIIEELCYYNDREIAMWSIRIIAELDTYKNTGFIQKSLDGYNESGVISLQDVLDTKVQSIEILLKKLVHTTVEVRQEVVEKLTPLINDVNIEVLEEIIKSNPGVEGIEALELLFIKDATVGWFYINTKMDSIDEGIRAGLVAIVHGAQEDPFFNFMMTMLNDSSPRIRKMTIKALYTRINDRSLSLLKKLYVDETDDMNRREIVSNLYRFDCNQGIHIIIDATNSSDILTRLAAIKSLSYLDSEEVTQVLHSMLNDPVEEVIEAVKEVLQKNEVNQ
ncbi:MAG: HEAT repeat domain-containing protein [Vallitaleaceae bacterium]|nr:HEAT repeat domain-containing protein [Vallitaleaceae bacterium]